MTQQDNGTTKENEVLSDDELYNLEWADDDAKSEANAGDAPSSDDGTETTGQEKAEGDETVSDPAVPDEAAEGSPKGSTEGSAESSDDDIWAGATDAQRVAYKNAQNGLNAMSGRARVSSKKHTDLEKELQKSKQELAEFTRTKGTYETEHPELFDEVRTAFASATSQSPEQSSTAPATDEVPDDIKVVFAAHPDASAVMASPEWADFQNSLTGEQVRQNNSDDPADFINLVSTFKTQEAHRKTAPSRNEVLLDAAAGPAGGSSSTPSRKKALMSAQESYDAEWDED
jgi:hypothetical protein